MHNFDKYSAPRFSEIPSIDSELDILKLNKLYTDYKILKKVLKDKTMKQSKEKQMC